MRFSLHPLDPAEADEVAAALAALAMWLAENTRPSTPTGPKAWSVAGRLEALGLSAGTSASAARWRGAAGDQTTLWPRLESWE